MKTLGILLTTAVLASAFPQRLAQQADATSANATTSPSAIQAIECDPPSGSIRTWWYRSWSDGPHGACSQVQSGKYWGMLNAYRAGGEQGLHWKYTDDPNDSGCLTNWKYYSADGKTLQVTVGRTTTIGSARPWCVLPVYRAGGVQGNQWGYCKCKPGGIGI